MNFGDNRTANLATLCSHHSINRAAKSDGQTVCLATVSQNIKVKCKSVKQVSGLFGGTAPHNNHQFHWNQLTVGGSDRTGTEQISIASCAQRATRRTQRTKIQFITISVAFDGQRTDPRSGVAFSICFVACNYVCPHRAGGGCASSFSCPKHCGPSYPIHLILTSKWCNAKPNGCCGGGKKILE